MRLTGKDRDARVRGIPAVRGEGIWLSAVLCRIRASQDNTLCMAWRSEPIGAVGWQGPSPWQYIFLTFSDLI